MLIVRHQIAAQEKKRPREERDLLNRMKVFARLQTAEDQEEMVNGMLCKSRTYQAASAHS